MERKVAASLEKIGGADFLVRILFRQNATWQGEVHWLNTGKRVRFRSFLELSLLMNKCLEESKYPPGECPSPLWEGSRRDEKASQP